MSKTITIASMTTSATAAPRVSTAPRQGAKAALRPVGDAIEAPLASSAGGQPPRNTAADEMLDFFAPRFEQAVAIVRLVGTIFDIPADERPAASHTFNSLEFVARLLRECEEHYSDSGRLGDDFIEANYEAIGLLGVLTELVWSDSCEFRQPDALYESYLNAVEGAIKRTQSHFLATIEQMRREQGRAA